MCSQKKKYDANKEIAKKQKQIATNNNKNVHLPANGVKAEMQGHERNKSNFIRFNSAERHALKFIVILISESLALHLYVINATCGERIVCIQLCFVNVSCLC